MASVKFAAVSRGVGGILDYVTNREKALNIQYGNGAVVVVRAC